MRWDGVVCFAVIFAFFLTLGSLLVSRDLTGSSPHIAVVGYSVTGYGWPLAWLLRTTPGAGFSSVLSVEYLSMILDYVIWLVVGLSFGTAVFVLRTGFYGS